MSCPIFHHGQASPIHIARLHEKRLARRHCQPAIHSGREQALLLTHQERAQPGQGAPSLDPIAGIQALEPAFDLPNAFSVTRAGDSQRECRQHPRGPQSLLLAAILHNPQ